MAKVLLVKNDAKVQLRGNEKPVSRAQVVAELSHLSHIFQDYYTLKARTQYCDPAAIKLPPAQKIEAIRLAKLGFVEPVGPLLIGPQNTIDVHAFGAAIGFFMARWSDMTHMPSPKWSPYLEPDPSMSGDLRPPPKGARKSNGKPSKPS